MKELVLLIDRRDANVTLEGASLCVRRPGHKPRYVPLGLLGQVIVSGNPAVEVRAWRALGERNIPTVLLPVRGRGEGIWMGSGLSATIAVRRAQHAAWNMDKGLEIARELVHEKIVAFRELALEQRMSEAVERMDDCLGRLRGAPDRNGLMGIEGAAASAWWEALVAHLDGEWEFKGRNRRPPRDPINALLSLGYTLLASSVAMAVRVVGLDPALGFLHGIVPGRDSLVLDLMEPLRAGVDAWVLELIRDGTLKPSDFTYSKEEGCRLGSRGRPAFYQAWADARMDWPQPGTPNETLDAHCRAHARQLRERLGPYDPQTGETTSV